ncbi:lipocalin family protein [Corynebacterium sp.]|uniref:lipocalin family protein n=1 Tax=Corynebacterium sp. TaxID=1720 RepID=UPI002A913136|nr:lipocalin family protein [Corynebacterium sp.]MDY5785266.1 lipocalin family protein [Corynebacterium sp.]
MRRILATALAVSLCASTAPATAVAQDIFDGGRLAGASSQLIPAGSSMPGGELREDGATVDLNRYAGTWYQVAAVPQPYTLQCVRDTTAEYAVVDPSTISVVNSCGSIAGGRSQIEGTATVRSDASLRVNFPGVPFQDPNGPVNYRVTYLAEDYSLAIVGDPNRLSGFVLSRTPNLTAEQWKQVRGVVENRGWWSCTFITQPMAGGRQDYAPLCTL